MCTLAHAYGVRDSVALKSVRKELRGRLSRGLDFAVQNAGRVRFADDGLSSSGAELTFIRRVIRHVRQLDGSFVVIGIVTRVGEAKGGHGGSFASKGVEDATVLTISATVSGPVALAPVSLMGQVIGDCTSKSCDARRA